LLTTADWLGIAGLAAAPIGVAAGVRYGRRRARLVFVQRGNVIVEQPNDDITVHWRGHPVPRVSRTNITVWNAGTETIEGTAVVPNYPLRFSFSGDAEVLSIRMGGRTNDENAFKAEHDPDCTGAVRITFDYLDARQGARFEVLHTSDDPEAVPSGTIKGVERTLEDRTIRVDNPQSPDFTLIWRQPRATPPRALRNHGVVRRSITRAFSPDP
jgi:hypothetical protein